MKANPYNVDHVDLNAAGSKTVHGFKGALTFRYAYSGGARQQDGRVNGETVEATAKIFVEIGDNGPMPLFPGEEIRSLDSAHEPLKISWFAQANIRAVLVTSDPERMETDFRKRAL